MRPVRLCRNLVLLVVVLVVLAGALLRRVR